MTHFLAGIFLGFSLIIAIGAQNVFVLRQGIRREHVLLVAVICAVSDALLILLGVSGIGAATTALPWLNDVVRWAGAVFLIGFAVKAAARAVWPGNGGLVAAKDDPASGDGSAAPTGHPASGGVATLTRPDTAVRVALTCLALTWLNPHVYLDTVFLLGSVAAAHGDQRWVFAAGAMLASVGWFVGLAYGARLLGRWLATARAWRLLDAGIAIVMLALGVTLVLPVG
ncbi:MAG: LysE/ArgO family amino acid transporter [Micropruina sp.]